MLVGDPHASGQPGVVHEVPVLAVDGDEPLGAGHREQGLSSPWRACPLTCTGSMPVWTTSAPRRCRPSMTRPTAHSLPGMGCALITTTSPWAQVQPLALARGHQGQGRHRLALRAGGDDADLARVKVVDVLDVDERCSAGTVEKPEPPGQLDVLRHRATERGHLAAPWPGRRRRPAGCGGCGWRSRRR